MQSHPTKNTNCTAVVNCCINIQKGLDSSTTSSIWQTSRITRGCRSSGGWRAGSCHPSPLPEWDRSNGDDVITKLAVRWCILTGPPRRQDITLEQRSIGSVSSHHGKQGGRPQQWLMCSSSTGNAQSHPTSASTSITEHRLLDGGMSARLTPMETLQNLPTT